MAKRGTPTLDYAAQWLDEPETTELTLPSGKRVVVRQPYVIEMARQGQIPQPLVGVVEEFIFDADAKIKATGEALAVPGQRLPALLDFYGYVDVIVLAACVRPRFAAGEPGPGEVPLARLRYDDRLAIWRWAEGLTASVATFRGDGAGAAGAVPAVDGGGEPGAAPERAVGDPAA